MRRVATPTHTLLNIFLFAVAYVFYSMNMYILTTTTYHVTLDKSILSSSILSSVTVALLAEEICIYKNFRLSSHRLACEWSLAVFVGAIEEV